MDVEGIRDIVEGLGEDYSDEYSRERVLSFEDYLKTFSEHPEKQCRNAVAYVRDAILHWGTKKGKRPWGEYTRYSIFDGIGNDCQKVVGMEGVQRDFFEALDTLARQGRTDKIVVLHGPPGSGKSTFFETLLSGMEAYSKTEEGAIYRFHWIFPTGGSSNDSSLGFRTGGDGEVPDTFAHLPPDEIEARIPGEMSDHPLLILPRDIRERVIRKASGGDIPNTHLLESELNPTNKEILDALLLAYEGDYEKVLKHVQVERFHVSRRYRRAAVFIEPQLHVDADIQQVTIDQSYKALPSDLRHLDLHRPKGDLVEGNRGIVVFEDLFKRPAEMNRYLLGTAEKGRVTVENKILQLDELLVGTANDMHLAEWSQTRESVSMRGRIELIGVPYLLDYRMEVEMYEQFLDDVSLSIHLAPHTVKAAAYWTVLTRMHPFKDRSGDIPDRVAEVLKDLEPTEKLELYSEGRAPSWVSSELGQEIRSLVPDLMEAAIRGDNAEGLTGLSSRRMKMILLGAARSIEGCLTPIKLFEYVEDILEDPDRRPSFRRSEEDWILKPSELLLETRDRYELWLENQLLNALDFVEESNFDDLFDRYVNHVRHHLEGEKVYNRVTDEYEPPDENLMGEVEEMLDITESSEDFRETVMSTIAAYSIENPDEDVEYRYVFPGHFETFHESVLKKQKEPILKSYRNVRTFLADGEEPLQPSESQEAKRIVDELCQEYGYCDECVLEAVGTVVEKWEEELES